MALRKRYGALREAETPGLRALIRAEIPQNVSPPSVSMLQPIVSNVLAQLESISRQDLLGMVKVVHKEINRLQANFIAIQAVLVDAELRQATESAVRDWLDKFKTASYCMDDVLDEWNTAILTSPRKWFDDGLDEQRQEAPSTDKLKVWTVKPSCFYKYFSKYIPRPELYFEEIPTKTKIRRKKLVITRPDIAKEIKRIDTSLDIMVKESDRFDFQTWSSFRGIERQRSTSFIDISEIHGLDKEKNELVSKLLSESNNKQGKDVPVISIVGMPGIGKTTLAQLIFNDKRVVNHFETRIWVSVSDPSDHIGIAKAILEYFVSFTSELSDLQDVLFHISLNVWRKKFLLVLDDMMSEDYSKWEPLHKVLNEGHNGSRILVTTQKKTAALMMNSIDFITIKELSEEKCWSLFSRTAFYSKSSKEREELEEIGRKLVGKCQGLPLAVKTIGSLMQIKRNIKNWQSIADCEMWELQEFGKDVFPSLLSSYFELNYMSRCCFSYCAIFPKDYLISKDKLIELWTAQGYLGTEFNNGEKYFKELAARYFFQEFEKDDDGCIIRCKMHKIVHDFARYLARNECLIMEVNDHEESSRVYSENRFLHTTLMLSEGATTFPDSIWSAKRLRCLLLHYGVTNRSTVSKVLPKLFGHLTCLRAVDMSGKFRYENLVIEIPREIGKLLHLRYLNLSFLKMEELPETLCELCNLQTLELNSCTDLKKLPQAMEKLINLRHLGNNETSSLSYMPKGIDRLTCLQTLSEFVVSGVHHVNEASSIESLQNLNNLRGCLTIKGLGNVKTFEAEKARLWNKKNLLSLYLNFDKDGEYQEKTNDYVKDEKVLEDLQPPTPGLKRLEIRNYSGKTIPNWMTLFLNLKMLTLHDCINMEYLPPLGKLSSLESLSLCSMTGVKRVGNEFLGISGTSSSSSRLVIFPKLETLKFLNMDEWEEWELLHGITIMPRLRSLSLVYCPKLKTLPDHLLQNETLEELNISWCSNLKQRYIDADDLFKISKVTIDFDYVQGHSNH